MKKSLSKTKIRLAAISFFLLLNSVVFAKTNLYNFIFSELMKDNSIKVKKMSSDSLLYKIRNYDFSYKDVPKGKIILNSKIGNTKDSTVVELPFILYVPEKYNFKRKTPLLVYLHGGISRENPIEVEKWDIKGNLYFKELEDRGWLGLFPTGKIDYTWWDNPGINNVEFILKNLKMKYNIDNDRIYMSGISDGGSGSYAFAALQPNSFASFYPIIGSAGVHSSSRNEAFAPRNFSNRFIFAINNKKDKLYPSKSMCALNRLLFENGADILYQEIPKYGHKVPYGRKVAPLITDLMSNHPRNRYKTEIYWECYDEHYSRCDWIKINKIDTTASRKEWHKQFQHSCSTKRLTFGFMPIEDVEKRGYVIKNVVEGSTAEKMGLKAGDKILKIDDTKMLKHEDIWEAKDNIELNKEFVFHIYRNNKKLELTGLFENYISYEAFPYNTETGAVKASYFNNEFKIETSKVDKITVYFSDKMISRNLPVNIFINGELKYNDTIPINEQFIKEEFLKSFDTQNIWFNKITLKTK